MTRQEYFSQADAARYLGVSRRTLRRAVLRGDLAVCWVGKLPRYRRGDIERLTVTASHRLTPPGTTK